MFYALNVSTNTAGKNNAGKTTSWFLYTTLIALYQLEVC